MFHSFRRICAILPGIMPSTPHIEKQAATAAFLIARLIA
jgi:hypothetical protein